MWVITWTSDENYLCCSTVIQCKKMYIDQITEWYELEGRYHCPVFCQRLLVYVCFGVCIKAPMYRKDYLKPWQVRGHLLLLHNGKCNIFPTDCSKTIIGLYCVQNLLLVVAKGKTSCCRLSVCLLSPVMEGHSQPCLSWCHLPAPTGPDPCRNRQMTSQRQVDSLSDRKTDLQEDRYL